MKQFPMNKIRNVALLGSGRAGKTALLESALFLTKGTDRLGRQADGNTVSDYEPEEIKRQISVSTAVAPVMYKDVKINFLDAPGYLDFVSETTQAARVAETALIVVSGKSGPGVGTEKAWDLALENKLSKAFFVNKLDAENANYESVIDKLREVFGISVCPLTAPIIEDNKVVGIIDFVERRAKKYVDGVAQRINLTDEMKEKVSRLWDMMSESIAETSEELMEKFFNGEYFTIEETIAGVKQGIADGSIAPVVCGSAAELYGFDDLFETIYHCFPSPSDRENIHAVSLGEDVVIQPNEEGELAAIVFKTVADPFVGRMSYFKVVSGTMKADSVVYNSNKDENEKIGKLFFMRGKKTLETPYIIAGDIGFATKLAVTGTGDTLCAVGKNIILRNIEFPSPCYSMNVVPLAKGDEEKIASGLIRMMDEDKSFRFWQDTETKQQLVSGLGDVHLDVIMSKLKNKFGTSVELKDPKMAYRETIRKKVKVEGKHKKQSGGHGQYGHVWIEFEPGENDDLIFDDNVFGGAVPKNFFPAVEKGLRDSMVKGVLAGYPVVNIKATLVDGSYHDVDSSEMAFKMAASIAYKAGMAAANPVILEPIGTLKVQIPDAQMGDIIGDINKRRGRILGMNPIGKLQEVEAEVPMAAMHSYAVDLRSMTGGRGSFEFEFVRYEQAPENVAAKIIAESKADEE